MSKKEVEIEVEEDAEDEKKKRKKDLIVEVLKKKGLKDAKS